MRIPRLLFAGVHSGCGKTTITCAVLQALKNRGLKLHAFKCGPDYVDPLFHQKILGTPGSNLDLFFCDEDGLRRLVMDNARDADLAVLEGVMGYYDGLSMLSADKSSYDIARVTGSPAVLVVAARGMAYSLVALVRGFLEEKPDSGIQGILLNQVSTALYPQYKAALEQAFGGRVKVYGHLPMMPDCAFESRQLGLVTADEIQDIQGKLQRLAAQAEQSLDLDGLLALAKSAPPLSAAPQQIKALPQPVRIAIARDAAFCFYYRDSLRLLEQLGARLIPFSPLLDKALPDCDGLYIGGGYPELHLEALSANAAMRASIRAALEAGLPCIAECGGFMYLTQAIDGQPMAGFLPGTCANTGRLTRFGYATLTASQDNLLCKAGECIPAHEFHYYDCTDNGQGFVAKKPSGKSWPCVHISPSLYAGFPHLPLFARPDFARNFCQAALSHQQKQEAQT